MNITIAMDSFKGSMSSIEAGNAVKNGIFNALNGLNHTINVLPVADGGEGTIDALTYGKSFEKRTINVTGPTGEKIDASYILTDDNMAIIEMAEAAGLPLVSKELRNPLNTTTFGVGELIKDAINNGCKHFIIGIGGSATNDCGIGMLQALGYKITDKNGNDVPFGAKGLEVAASIIDSPISSTLLSCDFTIACDVDNPLTGERGCSHVFSPQKGATPEMVRLMDGWMDAFASVVEHFCKEKDAKFPFNRTTPGSGAAGGIGFAFLMMLHGKLMSGAQIVIKETKLEEHIQASDMVIVGEGKLDAQSTMGKIPVTIAKLARKYGKKVIAYAGLVEDKSAIEKANIFDGVFEIDRKGMSLDEAMITKNSVSNLTQTVEKTFPI
ncbi:MAG: glycerate kinase [Kiritimatiellae bacterium]|nr:glycerate kinase [Kiritimatiellia bacterium]